MRRTVHLDPSLPLLLLDGIPGVEIDGRVRCISRNRCCCGSWSGRSGGSPGRWDELDENVGVERKSSAVGLVCLVRWVGEELDDRDVKVVRRREEIC